MSTRNIFRLLYLSLFLADLALFYLLFGFLSRNIADATTPAGLNSVPSARLSNDINIPLFESIIDQIERKSKH